MSPTTTTPPPPGVIMPIGDSLPTMSTHSLVAPPNNVEPGVNNNSSTGASSVSRIPTPASSVVPSSASVSPTTSDAVPASFAQATATSDGNSESLHPAAIVGIILLVLTSIGLILFFVRRYFVGRRASKVTPARSRASNVGISGPTNFQHVSTADRNVIAWNINDKNSMNVGTAKVERWDPHRQPSLGQETDLTKSEKPWVPSESPYGENKQKHTVNFGALESGLHDPVQTTHFARNPRQDSF